MMFFGRSAAKFFERFARYKVCCHYRHHQEAGDRGQG
jgi:hypothetical protein